MTDKIFEEVSPERLRWRCDPDLLPFENTKTVSPCQEIIGQERGFEAIRIGVDIHSIGYNLFVTGLSGTGRFTTIKCVLEEIDAKETPLNDLCYVNNFKNPDLPKMLTLPAGQGNSFKKEMEALIEALKKKILDSDTLASQASALRSEDRKLVLTNGCFDLLHVGHVRYLREAASLGDCLIVGLNSDQSVRTIKEPQRPLIVQEQRVEVLSALECVNFVVLFDEPDPYTLIETIRPDILAKGADWPLDKIIGADLVSGYGGKVQRITLVPAISTTEIINRILERYGRS